MNTVATVDMGDAHIIDNTHYALIIDPLYSVLCNLYHYVIMSDVHGCSLFIDTSYLFEVENEPGKSPSLRDIAQHVCNITLPATRTHDSVQDAKIAVQSVYQLVNKTQLQQQQQGGAITLASTVAALEVSPVVPRIVNGLAAPAACCLMVHRIPCAYTVEDVKTMFGTCSFVLPSTIQPITYGQEPKPEDTANASGKTTVIFSTEAHANLAFDSISGPNRPDKQNKAQKRVYLKNGGHICVRKY